MSSLSVTQSKLFEKFSGQKWLVEQGTYLILAFICAGAKIMGMPAPFGVAWVAAAPKENNLAATLGAILGYFVLSRESSFKYIGATLLLTGLSWALSAISISKHPYFAPASAAFSIGVIGFAIVFSDFFSTTSIIILLCEVIMALTAVILFTKNPVNLFAEDFLSGNIIGTGVFLAIIYMGLFQIHILKISLANFAAFAFIFLCSSYKGTPTACAWAIAAGLSASLCGDGQMLAVFCTVALLGGIFAPLGTVFAGIAAAVSAAMAALLIGTQQPLIMFLECILGVGVVFFSPPKIAEKLLILQPVEKANHRILKQAIDAQLVKTNQALLEISTVTQDVYKKLVEINADSSQTSLATACSQICRSCGNSAVCWQQDYNNTTDILNNVFIKISNGVQVVAQELPEYFNCIKKEELIRALSFQGEDYQKKRMEKRKAEQLRSISSDQFVGMQQLIASLQSRIREYKNASEGTAKLVEDYLKTLDCNFNWVCCYFNEERAFCLMIDLPEYKTTRLVKADVLSQLVKFSGYELCAPTITNSNEGCTMLWQQKPQFKLESCILQKNANHNRFCGDSCKISQKAISKAILLLCDGMGVGSPAAVDAELTSTLMQKLLESGADFNCATHLVNATLISGGGDERICTVDSSIINLYNGRVDVFKAGGSPTFVIKKGRCATLEGSSLPIGLLDGVECSHSSISLGNGDIVIMMSDGLIEDEYQWVSKKLAQLSEKDINSICKEILEEAINRHSYTREDDMSIMAARLLLA